MLFIASIIAGYMLLLVGLAVAAPGIGFIGSLLNLVPGDWRDWAHVPAYGVLAWLAILGFRQRGWPIPYAVFTGLLLSTVFGLWTEVAQGAAPGREASLQDVLKDLLGGMTAATLMLRQHKTARLSPSFLFARTTTLRFPMKGMWSR